MKEGKINFYKKIISILLIIAILLPCFPISVFAASLSGEDGDVTFSQTLLTSTNDIKQGDNVTISIQILDTSKLKEDPDIYEVYLDYDTEALKYQSAKGCDGWNIKAFDYKSESEMPMALEPEQGAKIVLEKDSTYSIADGTILEVTFNAKKNISEEEGGGQGTEIKLSSADLKKLSEEDVAEEDPLCTAKEASITLCNTEKKMWTITYDCNEGDDNTIPSAQSTEEGNYIVITNEEPSKDGYEFVGWSKETVDSEETEGVTTYSAGSKYKYEDLKEDEELDQETKNIALHAVWKPLEYKIVYFYNGGHKADGSAEETVENAFKKYGTKYNIEEAPVRDGYNFKCWYDIVNKQEYQPNSEYEAEIELYLVAQWEPAEYTVTFNAKEGEFPSEYKGNGYDAVTEGNEDKTKVKVTYNGTYAATGSDLPVPTRENYTFLGWYTEETNGVKIDKDSICVKTEDHNLYAHWSQNPTIQWDIYYNVDGNVTTEQEDEKSQIQLKEAQKKEGYTFKCWKNSEGQDCQAGSDYTVDGTEVFTAEWTANSHTVTFDANKGDELSSGDKSREVTYDTPYGSLPTPTRSGYIFEGWYTKQGTEPEPVSLMTTALEGGDDEEGERIHSYTIFTTDEDQTLYAHWSIDDSDVPKYTVQYEIDGEIDPENNVTVKIEDGDSKQIELKKDVYKKGYTFKGWKLSEEDDDDSIHGAGTQYTVTGNVKFIAVFEVKEVTITFELSQGTLNEEDQKTIKRNFGQKYNEGGNLPVPTRDGYTFTGWYTNEGVQVVDEDYVNYEENFTLSAKWIINSYTVIFDTNQGEPKTIDSAFKEQDTDLQLPKPTREGYDFVGWRSSEGETYIGTYNKNQSTTLTAQWQAKTFNITLNLNEGSFQSDEKAENPLEYGTEFELPEPVREGYLFKGWYDGNTIQGKKITVTEDKELKAKWIAETYKITYDVNGGKGTFYDQSRTINSSNITIFSQEPTKEGYKFTGWLSSSDNVIYKTDGNNVYSKLENTKFTAQYEELIYTIQYRPNSTDVHGNIENDTKEWNQSIALSDASEYTRQGYRFMGWSTDPDDDYLSHEYLGGASYTANEDITLYALWMDASDIIEENKIRIKYDMQGGTPQISTQIGSKENLYEMVSGIIPQKAGYEFQGWTTDLEDSTVEYEAKSHYEAKEDVTLHAVWKKKIYNIEYNLNGGTQGNSVDEDEVVNNKFVTQQKEHNGNSIYLYGEKPVRDNYTFKGWGATPTSTEPIYLAGDIYWENRDRVLYAIWTPVTYSIQYKTQGAKEVINTQYKTCEDTDFKISDVIPTKSGYAFDVWKDQNEKQYMSGDAYNENANLVLTAEYNAKQYTVTFNVEEGATVNKTNMTVEYGKEYGELPIPTKENSEFIGWYTKDDKPVTQETIFKQTEDQQLYAKWESTIYHVYYNANRGTGAPSTQTRTKNGDAIEIQGPGNMTKGGHEFKQWEDAEGKVYAEGTEYSDNKDLTLYAIWDSESYKITYDANGGTGAPAPYWKEYDEKYVLSKEGIEREGFIFKGWGLSNTTLAKDAISEYSGNSNVTVYAIWEENTRELRYDTLRGTNEPENQTKYYTQNLQVTDTIPQKTGYNFLGWSTKPYGSTLDDVEYKAGNTITSNDISVLYAVWELQTCALTYEANGGTGTPEGETLNYGQKTQISTVVPTRDGYNFVAWGVKGNEKLQYAPGSDYTIYNDNVVLSAIWKAQTYTVVYNANGGKNAPGSQTKVYKEDLLLSTVKPTRKGYIFVGWAEEPTATEAKYNSGADDGYYTEDKDATLYAVWQATEEGVKYMYYCKVEATDEDTDENTFDDFNSAKEYADAHKEENIKVYDANGTLIYNPLNNNEELYLESEVFTGQGSVENGNGEKTEYVKVDANTQLLEIINNCSTNGTVEVYSKNGTKLANKDVLGTGMKIKVTNKNAKTEYEITIVVTGDLDSDGKMSVSDLSSMTSYHTGAVSLDGVYSIAADVDKDNEVTISDLSSMINDLSK